MTTSTSATEQPLRILAAGSLCKPLPLIIDDFRQRTGIAAEVGFGPSGKLRQRIEAGEECHLFASADRSHPQRLAEQGLAREPIRFAGNRICVLARDGLSIDQDNLVPRLLDPRVRVGAPTPIADPGGDYAQAFFRLAEAQNTGAHRALTDKTDTSLGRPGAPRKSTPSQTIAAAFSADQIDAFVVYVSICFEIMELVDDLVIITPPPPLTVIPEFWMCLTREAPRSARRMAERILSPAGQGFLASCGFTPLDNLP